MKRQWRNSARERPPGVLIGLPLCATHFFCWQHLQRPPDVILADRRDRGNRRRDRSPSRKGRDRGGLPMTLNRRRCRTYIMVVIELVSRRNTASINQPTCPHFFPHSTELPCTRTRWCHKILCKCRRGPPIKHYYQRLISQSVLLMPFEIYGPST